MIAPAGCQVAAQHGDAGRVLQGVPARPDDVTGPQDLGSGQVMHQRAAGDRQRRGIEQVLHLTQHGQQAPGTVKVLHQVLPGGLQVDQQAAHPRPVDANAPRSCRSYH